VALVQAIDPYDPGRGMRLSTYVTWWVKQAIRRAAMSQSTPVRIPERLWERAGEAAQAGRTLRHRFGREVRDSDVAGALGGSEEDLAEVRRALQPVVSLEGPVGDEGSSGESWWQILALMTRPRWQSGTTPGAGWPRRWPPFQGEELPYCRGDTGWTGGPGASPPWERPWAYRVNGPASWRTQPSPSCESVGGSSDWRGWPLSQCRSRRPPPRRRARIGRGSPRRMAAR
jgi:hypothetical protein